MRHDDCGECDGCMDGDDGREGMYKAIMLAIYGEMLLLPHQKVLLNDLSLEVMLEMWEKFETN